MALPSTNLGFSNCFSEIGNGTPGAGSNISASVLFYDNWTAPNGIKGYGSVQNSGADRVANSQTGTQISLSNYLGLKVVGDTAAYQSGNGSYYSQWDNQLTGVSDNFYDVYLYLWDSTKTYQLTQDYLGFLGTVTTTGYTNIGGTSLPLVQDAFWEVVFTTDKISTNPFTFEIQCDILNNGTLNSIFSLNQTWTNNTTYSFSWQDPGNSSVQTANPTAGYAFQMLFY